MNNKVRKPSGTRSVCWSGSRYHHDGSETLEDIIQLTATDGTNPVDFELLVQVGVLAHI